MLLYRKIGTPICVFSTESVSSVIKKLRNKNSAGIDGLPAIRFKQLSNGLAFPLSMLFNLSMSTSKLPASWNSAIIIPLFKKGAPNNPCNYRPISIISHLYNHKLISKQRHGFLARRSTTTQLLECCRYLSVCMKSNKPVDVDLFRLR